MFSTPKESLSLERERERERESLLEKRRETTPSTRNDEQVGEILEHLPKDSGFVFPKASPVRFHSDVGLGESFLGFQTRDSFSRRRCQNLCGLSQKAIDSSPCPTVQSFQRIKDLGSGPFRWLCFSLSAKASVRAKTMSPRRPETSDTRDLDATIHRNSTYRYPEGTLERAAVYPSFSLEPALKIAS